MSSEQEKETPTTKYCKTCKVIKPLSEFERYGATYRQHCRICRGKPVYMIAKDNKGEMSEMRKRLNEMDERYRKSIKIIQEQMAEIEAVHAELLNMHISVIGNEESRGEIIE